MVSKNKIQVMGLMPTNGHSDPMSMLRLNKLMIAKIPTNAKNKINTMNKEITQLLKASSNTKTDMLTIGYQRHQFVEGANQ